MLSPLLAARIAAGGVILACLMTLGLIGWIGPREAEEVSPYGEATTKVADAGAAA